MSGRAEGKKRAAPSSSDSKASKTSRRRGASRQETNAELPPPPPTPSPPGLKTTGLDDVEDVKEKAMPTVEHQEDECKSRESVSC